MMKAEEPLGVQLPPQQIVNYEKKGAFGDIIREDEKKDYKLSEAERKKRMENLTTNKWSA